ncbi:hypothetical protein D3C78_724090 [compost metagenome]
MSSALTFTINNFFVGKYCTQCLAPVNRYFCYISQAFVVQLDENPLRPFVIIWICSADLAIPVVGETQRFDLTTEIIDVLICKITWMLTCVHCILLCRKSKSIPAHWVQHVKTAHPFVTGYDIRCCVAFWMTYVQSCT